MSILNVYVKKEGKTTWIQMDTFPLIYTTLTLLTRAQILWDTLFHADAVCR